MSYLLDTNILLRLVQKNSSIYADTRKAVLTLHNQQENLYIIPQNLFEFWAVATRPVDVNGLGLKVDEAKREMAILKQLFTLKPNTSEIVEIWESLVINYQVIGKQTHDSRLVAAMMVHGIEYLLTFNTKDFHRFSEITAISPLNDKIDNC